MRVDEHAYDYENETSVVLLIGVNGVGKTTSVGKLAGQFKNNGKKVILAAADTFRAAAIEQLTEWANRAGVELISGQEGGQPVPIAHRNGLVQPQLRPQSGHCLRRGLGAQHLGSWIAVNDLKGEKGEE